METSSTQPAEIARVAVRRPPFWAEQPDVWFAQAEAKSSLAGITSESTKFHHVISQLDHRYTADVRDIITSPLQQKPEAMGDRKPSQYLRHLRSLVPEVPDKSPSPPSLMSSLTPRPAVPTE
jgi:hypothetical protein